MVKIIRNLNCREYSVNVWLLGKKRLHEPDSGYLGILTEFGVESQVVT